MRGTNYIDWSRQSYMPSFNTPEQFADEKIEMLQNDFFIKLADDDIAHIKSLKTESDINIAVRGIINKYWR